MGAPARASADRSQSRLLIDMTMLPSLYAATAHRFQMSILECGRLERREHRAFSYSARVPNVSKDTGL